MQERNRMEGCTDDAVAGHGRGAGLPEPDPRESDKPGEILHPSSNAPKVPDDRYVDFYDSAPVGYLTLNAQGSITDINLAGAELLGKARAKVVQHHFGTWVETECAERWLRHLADVLTGDAKLNCEVALRRQDGSSVDVRVDSRRVTKADGTHLLHVVLTDISERKQADLALKLSEQRFRDMVNTTDGIVWEADATTFAFTFVSQKAESLLGFPVADWLQPGFWVQNLHPADKVWAPEYCASCTARLEPHNFEYRFITRDGRTVWLHDIVTVVAEGGVPRWLRGIMVDVTERKETEARLREMTADLEAKVSARTAQLRGLSAELAMTEERERRLLAQDLHDNLGQMLAVIKINLTSLMAGAARPTLSEIVAQVNQADQSVRTITQQLSPPILQTLGLLPALDWLAEEIERTYGIRVHVDNATCGKRLVDEVQAMLYRCVRELLINVAKHAGVREASLSCVCYGNRLMLLVSDDGYGFDLAEFGSLSPGQGGFGLHSIYERIANVGGVIEIDSSPGNGTTVSLTVPCSSASAENINDPNSPCR